MNINKISDRRRYKLRHANCAILAYHLETVTRFTQSSHFYSYAAI